MTSRPDTAPTTHLSASRAIRKLLREEEMAERSNYSVKTLQGWRHRHVGPPYIKIGRSVRYDPDAVDAYFAAKTVETQG